MVKPNDPTPTEAAEDAIVDSLVEGAVTPFASLLTPHMNAEVRSVLRDLLALHPAATTLIAELKPPPLVASSGEVPTGGTDVEAAPEGQAGGQKK